MGDVVVFLLDLYMWKKQSLIPELDIFLYIRGKSVLFGAEIILPARRFPNHAHASYLTKNVLAREGICQ